MTHAFRCLCWRHHQCKLRSRTPFAYIWCACHSQVLGYASLFSLSLIWVRFLVFLVLIFLRCTRNIAKRDYWLRYVCLSCPSVRPHETTRLLLDGFSWNLVYEYFLKICREFGFYENLKRIMGTLHEDLCTFMISRQIHLGMRNISDKSCKENKKDTFYVYVCVYV
jgi:hypothetical protein